MKSDKPNILVFATEAGSAENLAAIVRANQHRASFTVFGVGAGREVFWLAGLAPSSKPKTESEKSVCSLLTACHVDAVLIGRCIDPNSYERVLVRAAKRIHIPCVSIIDEWYDYKRNYIGLGNVVDYPNVICCPDSQAFDEAVSEGLPEGALQVTGSPALTAFVNEIAEQNSHNPGELSLDKSVNRRLKVLLLSEKIDSECQLDNNPLEARNSQLGYDEFRVRSELCEVLGSSGEETLVIEKLHPSMAIEKFPPLINKNIEWQVTKEMPLLSCLIASDIVIGMRSVALLKSYIAGLPTLSYQPSLSGENRCTAVRKALIECATTKVQLARWILGQTRRENAERKPVLDFLEQNSTTKVFSVIKSLISNSEAES